MVGTLSNKKYPSICDSMIVGKTSPPLLPKSLRPLPRLLAKEKTQVSGISQSLKSIRVHKSIEVAIYREYPCPISLNSVSADGIRSFFCLYHPLSHHQLMVISPVHHLCPFQFLAIWGHIPWPNPTSLTWESHCIANQRAAAVSGPLGVENARAGAFHQLLSSKGVFPMFFRSSWVGFLKGKGGYFANQNVLQL